MPNLLHPDDTEEEDPVPETPNDPGEFVLADTADDTLLAGLLARACEEAGIPAIVQDPRDALYPQMPQSALDHVDVDHRLPLASIATLLTRLARTPVAAVNGRTRKDHRAGSFHNTHLSQS